MFPGGLLSLGLSCKYYGVGGGVPIGSGVKGEIWGQDRVKAERIQRRDWLDYSE